MNAFLRHRYIIRQNIFVLISLSLCLYFSYHATQGNRSFLRLGSLNQKVATMSQKYDDLHVERVALEKKVVMMRPGSLDRDLLEEQARIVLGYKAPDEMVILQKP